MKKNDFEAQTKSVSRIIGEHLFTLFNLINAVLALALILCGSYKNLFFMGTVVTNFAIGVFWEIRAKLTLEKLRLVTQSEITVARGGVKKRIHRDGLVKGDTVLLEAGVGIVCDGPLTGGAVTVDESSLTGEEDPVEKKPGDVLLSGTVVIRGGGAMRAVKIGGECYAAGIARSVKGDGEGKSVMMRSLNRIILIISIVIIPMGILMILRQNAAAGDFTQAVVATSAALVGMIPDGLMLLTSTVLAIGVVRLAKKKVLVQELYSIESLARTDTVCLDKTGTLTTGNMSVEGVLKWSEDFDEAMSVFAAASRDGGATLRALRTRWGGGKAEAIEAIPFDSARKFSAVRTEKTSLVLGAPEIVGGLDENKSAQVKENAAKFRVVALYRCKFDAETFGLSEREPLGAVLLSDQMRSGVREALDFFYSQKVDVKIISGDNLRTVQTIAEKAGVRNCEKAVDASRLTEDELREAAAETTIFARVTPERKRLIIKALKDQGRTVAMTGDGVNDVAAMRVCDCAVAPASGTDAAKNAASLVMLDDDFCSLPHVVAQGRQCIGNVERSSSVFLTKTVLSAVLTVIFLIWGRVYPFTPVQLTLVGVCGIGIPSFLLGLEPSRDRISGNFLSKVARRALPGGVAAALGTVACAVMGETGFIAPGLMGGAAALSAYLGVFCSLAAVTFPLNRYRLAVTLLSLVMFTAAFWLIGPMINVAFPGIGAAAACLGAGIACQIAVRGAFRLAFRIKDKGRG